MFSMIKTIYDTLMEAPLRQQLRWVRIAIHNSVQFDNSLVKEITPS